MTIAKRPARHIPLRRRKTADPNSRRSMAAKERNKNPCAECKRNRQKCLYGMSNTCSRCRDKSIPCERANPRVEHPLMIHTEFILEDGQGSNRVRPRSDTIQTVTSSVGSPVGVMHHDEDNHIGSLISPTDPSLSGFVSNDCESPTTQLAFNFGSFTLNQSGLVEGTHVTRLVSRQSNEEPCQQGPVLAAPEPASMQRNMYNTGFGATSEEQHPDAALQEVISGNMSISMPGTVTASGPNATIVGQASNAINSTDGPSYAQRAAESSEAAPSSDIGHLYAASIPISSAASSTFNHLSTSLASGLFNNDIFSEYAPGFSSGFTDDLLLRADFGALVDEFLTLSGMLADGLFADNE